MRCSRHSAGIRASALALAFALLSCVAVAASPAGQPTWAATPRLQKVGEAITFTLEVPTGAAPGELAVFERYLERAGPDRVFTPGGAPDWVERLSSRKVPLSFSDGRAVVTYKPRSAGNHLARWRVGGQVLYRYFASIDDRWTVVRYTTGGDWQPNLHGTGIPSEFRLEAEKFRPDEPLVKLYADYQRRFGDAVVPLLPDTPGLSVAERTRAYGKALDTVRAVLPEVAASGAVQIAMLHETDPGYAESLAALGVTDQGGMWEANGKPWLGMPEFPYFASPVDMRKPNQAEGGWLTAHQWDFCGSWHFLGPPGWHYVVAEGDWPTARKCLTDALDEARNMAEMSGHPAVFMPLFDGVNSERTLYPRNDKLADWDPVAMRVFMVAYQRAMAFEFTRRYRLAFARSEDISDYYCRHFRRTPSTVFVSSTDHLLYDMWWLCNWTEGVLVPRQTLPWLTRMSALMRLRKASHPYKDPLACEYILIEDQRRQMRFERECPNPVWWFDYTNQQRGPGGSTIAAIETPDVEVLRTGWVREGDRLVQRLRMKTDATVPDYAIVIWGIPWRPGARAVDVRSTAKRHQVAYNRKGERHVVLTFDLKPNAELELSVPVAWAGATMR